ncbi:uncharacterized protein LOC117649301 [Thrips palmi]|uniref:Uncharacterized protein LOC117649301 n=1 Tax=Thrips palmi TaxID=161013 RepID=A0A6P8ZRL5_THRPL|nr:uncharacterized protein LOC117649301 [Thrips palmi]XP_034247814.1 uncharacterized protein LOC117649301 [Thrips palmi]XP_034247815.1 uncharacterized protein LOC117649301 [Thrips palmi]XP_034247816.1 uncharacterized protein LOC117649301 [Thrips palmi]
MHSMGLHSALAIKRQRKRRDEQRRARERRYSQQSNESGLGESNSSFVSPRSSVRGRHRRHQSSTAPDENKMMSSVGMLHIGVVFLVVGGFLLGSGLLPEDVTSWSHFTTSQWWNELTIAGGCAILLGVFLIVLNRYMAKREEEDLTEYVQRQLTRSRSGHRLVRDVETGALTNKHNAGRSAADRERAARSTSEPEGLTAAAVDPRDINVDGGLSPLQSPSALRSPPHHLLHCDLEQILEEDGVSDRGDLMAPSPASAFSQGLVLDSEPFEPREMVHHAHGHHGRLDSQHSRHDSQHSRHDSQHSRHDSQHSHHEGHHGRHDSQHSRHDSQHSHHEGHHEGHHGRHDSNHSHHEAHSDLGGPYGHRSHHMVAI